MSEDVFTDMLEDDPEDQLINEMSDILEVSKNLETRLRETYGNPLANYKKTQHDVHMTYYVGRLMEEQGHKHVIRGSEAYYSERAMHDAFLAGRLLSKANRKEMRKELIEELKEEMSYAIKNIDLNVY